jgi:hypothetical protein
VAGHGNRTKTAEEQQHRQCQEQSMCRLQHACEVMLCRRLMCRFETASQHAEAAMLS